MNGTRLQINDNGETYGNCMFVLNFTHEQFYMKWVLQCLNNIMFMDEINHVFIDQLIKIDEMKLYMDELRHHGSLN
jgi:hypothetical protein